MIISVTKEREDGGMHIFKKIPEQNKNKKIQAEFDETVRKISQEKKIGEDEAIKEIDNAKKYHCGFHQYYDQGLYKLYPDLRIRELKVIERDHLVKIMAREANKTTKDINGMIDSLNEKFYLDYKEFYNRKYHLLSMDRCIRKYNRDKKINAVDISEVTSAGYEEALARMEKVCSELEINHYEYFKRKYYLLHEMDILNKLAWRRKSLDELVKIVVEETGVDYDEARRRMSYLKERYGVTFSNYVLRMYYMWTEEEIVKDIRDDVQEVCNETGWTYNEALYQMNKMKNKYNISHARYRYCRYFSVSEEEARDLEQEYKDDRYAGIAKCAKELGVGIRDLYEDMRIHCLRYGDPEDYYLAMKFYSVDKSVIPGFFHGRDGDYILPRKYNTDEGHDLLFNKEEFDKLFSEQLGRKWWSNSKDNSFRSFQEFLSGLDEIFIKPIESSRGRGCRKLLVKDCDEKQLYDEMIAANEKLLVEECIKPHPVIKQFGGGSVSSIRAIVLYLDGKLNIFSAYLRVGSGEITDNISVDGIAIEIDPDTGIIISDGMSKYGDTYERDQFSGVKFKGVQIPYWKEAIELMESTMKGLEGKVRYAGLDIAITEKGPVLIEANSHAHLHRIEFFKKNETGNRYIIEKFL